MSFAHARDSRLDSFLLLPTVHRAADLESSGETLLGLLPVDDGPDALEVLSC